MKRLTLDHRLTRRRFIASAILLCAVAGTLRTDESLHSFTTQRLHIETARGDVRATTLLDGTLLQINEKSQVRVKVTERSRVVSLDSGALQIVVPRNQLYRLLFTAPNVRTSIGEGKLIAVVSENKGTDITLAPDTAESIHLYYTARADWTSSFKQLPSHHMVLRPGQNILIRSSGELVLGAGVFNYGSEDLPRILVVFRNARLADVLSDFNRYYKTPAKVTDREVAALPINGVFNAYDRPSLIQFLTAFHGMTVRSLPDGTLIVSRPSENVTHRI